MIKPYKSKRILNQPFTTITDDLKVRCDKIWFLGDEFVNATMRSFPSPIGAAVPPYSLTNFEAKFIAPPEQGRAQRDLTSTNAVGHIINNFIHQLNSTRSNSYIPKWIVIIPEADLLNSVQYSGFGVTAAYGIIIQHLLKKFDHAITSFIGEVKEKKLNKFDWPYILWIEPSLNKGYGKVNNNLRIKFARSLYNAAQVHSRVIILSLKQGWNPNDETLTFNRSLSPTGALKFWAAIDNTVRYADVKILRNFGLSIEQVFQKRRLHQEADSRLSKYEQQLSNGNIDFNTHDQHRNNKNLTKTATSQAKLTSMGFRRKNINHTFGHNITKKTDASGPDVSHQHPHAHQPMFHARRNYSDCFSNRTFDFMQFLWDNV